MPRRPSDNDLLQRYLSGNIDARQQAELERRAAEDPDLQAALDGLTQDPEHDHAASVERMLLKAAKTETQPAAASKPATFRRLPRYWLATAASILLLAVALFAVPRIYERNEAPLASAESARRSSQPAPGPTGYAQNSEQEISPPPPPEHAREPQRGTTKSTPATTLPPGPGPAPEPADSEPFTNFKTEADAPTGLAAPPQPAEELYETSGEGSLEQPAVQRPSSRKRTIMRPPTPVFSGRVTDEDGYPIPGATLRQPGLPLGIEADSTGAFTMEVDATVTHLSVSADGFAPTEVQVETDRENIQIIMEELNPAPPSISEELAARSTVLTDENGDGQLRRKPPPYARSRRGIRTIRQQLIDERPAEVPHGKVRFNFLVRPDGRLTDFQFRKKTDRATRRYLETAMRELTTWEIARGDEPVRVYFKVVL